MVDSPPPFPTRKSDWRGLLALAEPHPPLRGTLPASRRGNIFASPSRGRWGFLRVFLLGAVRYPLPVTRGGCLQSRRVGFWLPHRLAILTYASLKGEGECWYHTAKPCSAPRPLGRGVAPKARG